MSDLEIIKELETKGINLTNHTLKYLELRSTKNKVDGKINQNSMLLYSGVLNFPQSNLIKRSYLVNFTKQLDSGFVECISLSHSLGMYKKYNSSNKFNFLEECNRRWR